MAKSKVDRWAELHKEAMSDFDAIWSAVREERLQSLSDRRFATIRGAQWEGQYAFGEEVDADGNPIELGRAKMEVPLFLLPMRRMQGEYRASRKTVDFRAKDDDSERATADNLDGLYRADENESRRRGGGQLAYDNAFQEASKGGMGAWRLRARYEDESDEENEEQRISIEPIYDADQCVFFDLDAKDQQKSDARRAYLLFTLSRAAFEARYPKASASTFDKETWTGSYEWIRPDTITLAEYFRVEDDSVLRRTFRQTALDDLDDETKPAEQTYDDAELTAERDDGSTLEGDLEKQGFREVRSRRIKRQRVRKYLLSGAEVLEDEGYIAGDRIPIVPLYAERSVVEGVERHQGMVRPVIDSTRINNVLVSNLTEAASDTSAETPIAAPEQMAGGLDAIWAKRKVSRPGYLPIRPIYKEDGTILHAGLLGTLPPPQVAPNAAALLQIMPGFISQLMGENEQPRTVPSNTSAAAIKLVNDQGDVSAFLWQDNFSLAMMTSGEVYVGMARELYVEEGRKMTALSEEGEKAIITLAMQKVDEDGAYTVNDFTKGRYDVEVDVGPATKTKRDATVESCLNIAQAASSLAPVVPEAGQIAFAMMGTAITQMEAEGIDGPRAFVRKMGLAGGWIEPTEEERAEMEAAKANQPEVQDPALLTAQASIILAQAEASKAESGRLEAEARLITAQANARKAEAETMARMAEIPRDDRAQILAEVRAEAELDDAERDRLLGMTREMEGAHGDAA